MTARKWLWTIVIVILLLIAAYLFGFIPQYNKLVAARGELDAAKEDRQRIAVQLQQYQLRDSLNRMYLEVSLNNFGLASQHASEMFNEARSVLSETTDPGQKKVLDDVVSHRDQVVGALAKADPGVKNQLAGWLLQLYGEPQR